jgi:hypothetical protein
LSQRWGSVRRLVEDAQHLPDIEVVVVVTDEGDRVSCGVVLGVDAVVLLASEPWATTFITARPWVPVLVRSKSTSEVVLARGRTEN